MCVHIDSTQLSRGVTPIAAIGYAGVGMGYSKEGRSKRSEKPIGKELTPALTGTTALG